MANIILALEVVLLAIPTIKESWRDFRYWPMGGLYPYYLLGGGLLLLFVVRLIQTTGRRINKKNNIPFTLAILTGAIMFFWSWYIDFTTLDPVPRKLDEALHDSLWFPLLAMFTLLFYLHLEFQTYSYPPLWRVLPLSFSIAPAFVVGIASLLSGENYIRLGLLGVLVTTLAFLGLVFAASFGTVSYYRSLKNYYLFDAGPTMPAQIQFASLAGLTEGMILFAVDQVLGRVMNIQFPLILMTFLFPLIIIYGRNPNYITTLASPILELLVVNESGVTVYSYNFLKSQNQETSSAAYLKGSVISAIFTVFNEIAGKDSNFNEVMLEDRAFLVEKVTTEKTIWTIGLIVVSPCFYVKQSLNVFSQVVRTLIKEYGVSSDGAVVEFPKEINAIVKDIFT